MSTLLKAYKENKIVNTLSQRMYYSNIKVLIIELKELSLQFNKDAKRLLNNKPKESDAYLINNMLYLFSYLNTLYFYVWSVQYESSLKDKEKLEKIKDSFGFSEILKLKLLNKLNQCIDLVVNLNNKKLLKSYCDIQIENINNSNRYSKKVSQYKNDLRSLTRKYDDDIEVFRKNTGFAVLKSRKSNDWACPNSLDIYLQNAKILGQKGPTILISNTGFTNDLMRLNESADRKSFFNQALKNNKIKTLWNKTLLKKVHLANELGYSNYLDLVISKNILNSKKLITTFLKGNLKNLKPDYIKTLKQIRLLSKKNGNNLSVADIDYYFNKLSKNDFSHTECFKIENAIEVFSSFLRKSLNISMSFKRIDKKNNNFWLSITDLESKRKGSILLTNINKSNFTITNGDYFDKNEKAINFSFVNIAINDDGFLCYEEVGILFHEFGHALQNFIASDKSNNEKQLVWETVEVPSLLLESLSKSYKVLGDLNFYKTKQSAPKKLSLYIFNKLHNGSKESKFYEYIKNYKFLIMVEMYSKKYEELKAINPGQYLTQKLIDAKVPYLWTDDAHNFISEYNNDYGSIPYIYLFSQEIVNVLIDKIKKKDIIEGNKASVNYIFRHLLISENGVNTMDVLNKLYKERKNVFN